MVALHVDRRGVGDPIVLTHGYGADSSTWDLQVDALSEARTVVTWDLRAHGRTPPSAEGRYSQDTALADLIAVVGDESAVLVGHSFGGYLSLLVAINRPDLVSALVLIATGPGYRNDESRAKWNDYARRASARMTPPPEAAGMLLQRDSFVIDHLDQITVPVLHVVGAEDTQFHAGHAHLQSRLPDAEGVMLAGAGHHPHVDASDEVNAAVLAFLTRIAGR